MYVKAYLNGFELLYGKSFSNPGHFLPYDPFPLTKWISMNYIMTPTQIKAGIVGSSPANYIGEILLNFGFFGAFIYTYIIGLLIIIIHHFTKIIIDKKDKNPIYVMILVFITIKVANIAKTSIESTFSYLTILATPIWIILIIAILISNIYLKKYKKDKIC
jgi:hypothetical protein